MSCSFASSDFCYSRLLEEETILNSTSFFFTTDGRVAQLAVIGYIVPEIFRWGFDIAPGVACADVPNGVAAIDAIPALGWAQIIFAIGAVDVRGWFGNFDIGKPDLKGKDEERALQELQHGRLAMPAAAGFLAQEVVDGKGILAHFAL